MRRKLSILLGLAATLAPSLAHAEREQPSQPGSSVAPASSAAPFAPPTVDEPSLDAAPPPPPRRHGLVLASSLGVLGYLGSFGHVAPPSFLVDLKLGYEPLRWLMVFGYGELAVAQTSIAQSELSRIAFSMYGFGGGLRATIHPAARLGLFMQGAVGFLEAVVPARALSNLGYPSLEKLHLLAGGRIGAEWYQKDRHLALGIEGGPRWAPGFERAGKSETAMLLDGALTVRYTF